MKLSVALLALGGTIANHGSSAFQTPTTVGRTSKLKNNNRIVGGSESSALMAATMDGTAVVVNGGQKRKKTKAVSSRKLNIIYK